MKEFKSKNNKVYTFIILLVLVLALLMCFYFYYSNGKNTISLEDKNIPKFGEITIGESFLPSSFEQEYDFFKNNKILNKYEIPDGTTLSVNRVMTLSPRIDNKNGKDDNILKFISKKVDIGVNKENKIVTIEFMIESPYYKKPFNTIKAKKLTKISTSVSKEDSLNPYGFEKEPIFDYVLKYKDEDHPNIIMAIVFKSKSFVDIVTNEKEERVVPLKDIEDLSILFYDESVSNNDDENDLLF